MTGGRTMIMWTRVAAHAAGHGRRVSAADVCAVAVSSTQLGGAWLAAARGGGPDFVMCVTGLVSEQLAELQLMLGEGPCHDVLASAAPVLAADLGDEESVRRWPGFTPAARRLGAEAVFAVPLVVGAIRAGVLGLYRGAPGPLPGGQLGDLLILADVATVMLLGSAHGEEDKDDEAGLDGQAPELALHRAEIDQVYRAPGKVVISHNDISWPAHRPVMAIRGRRAVRTDMTITSSRNPDTPDTPDTADAPGRSRR